MLSDGIDGLEKFFIIPGEHLAIRASFGEEGSVVGDGIFIEV